MSDYTRRQMLARLGVAAGLPVLGWAQSAYSQSPLANAFDDLIRQLGFKSDGPGLAVFVHQPGKKSFVRCAGRADLERQAEISRSTLFELASVSKTMTATAILMLQDRGKLAISDDVRKFIPELPEYNQQRPIQIQHLLHHTSGLASYLDFQNVPAKNKDFWINDDYVGEFARQKIPLDFPTGRKYAYNNSNYMLLAFVIERITKKTYGEFLKESLFVPAGMKTAFVNERPTSVPGNLVPACAVGYEKQAGKWSAAWGVPPTRKETLFTVGDGSIWCSLGDMAAWDAALRSQKLLKPKTAKDALRPSKTLDGKVNQYGLGWSLYPAESNGLNGYGHDGSWGGFHTSYYRYLPADRTSVILSNRGDFDVDKFWYALNDALEKHRFGEG